MGKIGLKTLPSTILAMALGFLVFPVWSLSFANPFEIYIRTGSVLTVISNLLPFWIGPLLIVFFALRRSIVVLPLFLLECCGLFVQTMLTPLAASPYLQITRIVLLFALFATGFLLMSKEMIFPLLGKNGRRWRSNVRFYLNQRATIESFSGEDFKTKSMIENASKSGILISASASELDTHIQKLKPGAKITLSTKFGSNQITIKGRVVWYETTGPIVRFGIEGVEAIPIELFVRQSSSSESHWDSLKHRLVLLASSRAVAITLWSIVIGGTLSIPNCGREDGSGVARVGDAPEEGTSKINLVWDRNESDGALQLANAAYQIVSTIDRCKSGYTARIDWTEDADSRLPIPFGDSGCVMKIVEIRLGNDYFLVTTLEFDPTLDAINKFRSASGSVLEVINKKVLPPTISDNLNVEYSINAISQVEPIVLKVELPQNACSIELAEGANPLDSKKVNFNIRVHPAYLPYAKALTFFPCGESQQWLHCKSVTNKRIAFISNFTKIQPKTVTPYVVTATLDVDNPAIRNQALNEGKSLSCSEYFYFPK